MEPFPTDMGTPEFPTSPERVEVSELLCYEGTSRDFREYAMIGVSPAPRRAGLFFTILSQTGRSQVCVAVGGIRDGGRRDSRAECEFRRAAQILPG